MMIEWQADEGRRTVFASHDEVTADVRALSNGEHYWQVTILSETGTAPWACGYESTRQMAADQAEGAMKRAFCVVQARRTMPVAA